jgi:hypothetical protein
VSEIEKTIRPFLQKHNGTSYEHFEIITTDLNSKATGKNLSLPIIERKADSGGVMTTTRPDFKPPSSLTRPTSRLFTATPLSRAASLLEKCR